MLFFGNFKSLAYIIILTPFVSIAMESSLVRTLGRPVFSSKQQEHTDYRVFANSVCNIIFENKVDRFVNGIQIGTQLSHL